MRLTEYTDYTLRVLMYCAAHPGQRVTIAELAAQHQISKNHLMKVVNDLARQGVIATTRGRGGGLTLLQPAAEIRVGDIVRRCETDFRLVECFDPGTVTCTLNPGCRLKGVFNRALQAFLRELDGATLADITAPSRGSPPAVVIAPPRSRSAPSDTAPNPHDAGVKRARRAASRPATTKPSP